MTDSPTLLDHLRDAVRRGAPPGPRERAALVDTADPAVLRRAGTILAGLPEDTAGLRPVRLAVLGTATLGSYPALLRAALVGSGMLPVLTAGDYGAFELTLATGRFAEPADPDIVSCVLDERFFLPADVDPTDLDGLEQHVRARFGVLRDLLGVACARSVASVVVHTVPLPASVRDAVLGWRDRAHLTRVWHTLNADIAGLAESDPRIAVVDLVGVLAGAGVPARDDRLHRYGDLPYTDAALLRLAQEVRRFAQAKAGLSRKVLALDLDNTLWGGVLGEVGASGVQLGGLYPGNCYRELQRTARVLRDQGVLLVLASKNDAEPVQRALAEHPEMVLRPEAFSASAVNWAPKAGNLRAAADSLNLDVSSFVFVDDSPFERGHVAAELPEVAVLPADGDPAHLVSTVLRHGWFDVPELTSTDRARPELYRTRALRNDFATGFASSEDYLGALGIELTPEPATPYTVGRIAQLAARTNQFNLAGRRFDEARTAAMSADPGHLVVSFTTRDRFGEDGIVGAAWVECRPDRWRVLDLVLSCQVLGRGVEFAAAAWLVEQARAAGASTVDAEFVPSSRNGVAADYWTQAGFAPTGVAGRFRLGPDARVPAPSWITVRTTVIDEKAA